MPPLLALAFSLALSVVLLRWDARYRPGVSAASWIPTLWMFVLGSRSISAWLNLGAPRQSAADVLMEGSPVDRAYFIALMLCGAVVLARRRVQWGAFLRNNLLFTLFMIYCLVSVGWSDYPSVSLRRWFKALGDPLMVLVLLTDQRPSEAITAVLRRLAFFLIPLSIVFIKYFPALGRGYSEWTGEAYYIGVAGNKNLLGYLLFVFGLLFVCTIADRKRWTDQVRRRGEVVIGLMMLGMILWLFQIADTKTPLIAALVASAVALSVGAGSVRRHLGALTIGAILLGVAGQAVADLTGGMLSAVGRDATLTGRTELWAAVLAMARNPLLGAGFEAFWLGPRLITLWQQFDFGPTQAHNGYIEMYLNLGALGLILFALFLMSTLLRIRTALNATYASAVATVDDFVLARCAPGYALAMLLYNITEATFKPLNFLFITLLCFGMVYRTLPGTDAHRVAAPTKPRAGSVGRRSLRRAARPADLVVAVSPGRPRFPQSQLTAPVRHAISGRQHVCLE